MTSPTAFNAGEPIVIFTITTEGEMTMFDNCPICNHEKLKKINMQLIRGKSVKKIAKRFGVDCEALEEHRACLSEIVRQMQVYRELEEGLQCLKQLDKHLSAAEAALQMTGRAEGYPLTLRTDQLIVTYDVWNGKRWVEKRATLSEFLAEAKPGGRKLR
jgi:hypothetical protein